MHEREWVELGKIDYFLEQLARAVERGEVHRTSYEILAPRYLERRAELVGVIEGTARRAEATTTAPDTAPASQAAAVSSAPVAVRIQPARRRFSWTTALIVTGAFLVINAAGLFVLAAWDVFGVTFQVAFLTAVTAAFYGAGVLVRKKLEQSVGGVALIVVGSALLLFDGWLLIDVFGLTGPWPWAAWLLLCSAVYWFTETRITGGFFGIVGAAAQVAWWWLLGEGFGWDPLPRFAALAVVSALWAVAARRGRDVPSLSSMARVLHFAAPVLAGIVLLGAIAASGVAPGAVALSVFCALVIAWSTTAVAEATGLPGSLGAVGHLPLLMIAASQLAHGSGWPAAALLAAGAAAAVTYELLRGGALHGVIAPLLAASAASVAALGVGAAIEWRMIVIAASGAAFVIAGRRLRRAWSKRTEITEGRLSLPGSLTAGGLFVLLAASVALLPALMTIPLAGLAFVPRDAATIAAFLLLWTLAAFVGRSSLAAAGMVAASLLALASALDIADVAWTSPALATPFLALILLWLMGRALLEKWTRLPELVTAFGLRALTLAIVAIGLSAEAVRGGLPHWTGALLLAAAAVWWFADRELTGERFAVAPAAIFAVWAAGHLGEWIAQAEAAGLAAAVASLVGAGACAALRRRPGFGAIGLWTFVGAGVVALPFAAADADTLALAAILCAAAVVIAVFSSRLWWGLVGAVALATVSVLATLAHFGPSAWVTAVALVALAGACLLPLLARRRDEEGDLTAITTALAVSGTLPLLALLGLGALSSGGGFAEWLSVYGQPLVFGLVAFGAYVLTVSTRYKLEPGFYLGIGLVVLALFVELDALDARWIELYSTPGALYVAWCGYRWASRRGDRTVPLAADMAASVIALGVPFIAMLQPGIPTLDSWVHTLCAFGLALAGIALGVFLRVRVYFFAGIAAVIITALARTWDLLLLLWWLLLGIVGTAMMVVALARELREAMTSGVRDLLDGWR